MREVFIVGVGMTRFGAHPDQSSADLARSAVQTALTDARAAAADVGATFYANTVAGAIEGQYGMKGQHALRPIGIQGGPLVNVENACAGGATAFNLAVLQVGAGLADVALAVGTEKMNTDDRDKRARTFGQPQDVAAMKAFVERVGPSVEDVRPPPEVVIDPKMFSLFMEGYALQAKAHMKKFGTTWRQIAAVSAKNHFHSTMSPLAQFQKDFSIEQILAAKVIAWPLTMPMCSPISDGSAAVLVCSKEALTRFEAKRAVRVLASVIKGGTDREFEEREKGCGRRAADAAYELAGIGPEDIHVAEVHDGSAYGEIAQLESCRLVALGEGGRAAEAGETRLGGRIPVNTAGGLESRGHPVAATGCAQLHELVLQLRGEAGARQVPNARRALASTSGGFMGVEDGIAAISLLGRL
jgi:acetyl-CoA acyltransferase